MAKTTLPAHRGVVDGVDPTLLAGDVGLDAGELQEGEGVVYEPGDHAAHKHAGRTVFNSTAIASKAVNGLRFVEFDNEDDVLAAQVDGTLYVATAGTSGTFASARTGLTATATTLDSTKFGNIAIMANGVDAPWVLKADGTTIQLGMTAVTGTLSAAENGAGSIDATYQYWYTEYDDVNEIESAFSGTRAQAVLTAAASGRLTIPLTAANTNTVWFRMYRTKDLGSHPIGWDAVGEVAVGAQAYIDDTGINDADLVGGNPYPLTTLNNASESTNLPPPTFRSVSTFQGSVCGVAGTALYYSKSLLPHYYPASYALELRTEYGGQARCVRRLGRILVVLMDHEIHRVNYLPKEADSYFDRGMSHEQIGSHGTPSPTGACVFTGWGGSPMLFYAARGGPMLCDGNSADMAVKSIDWPAHVSLANLNKCVAVNNPDKWRVELYYQNTANAWRCLHFYYDPTRIKTRVGFPEMVWTGPHIVPGSGTFGVVNGKGYVWTGSRSADGYVYNENTGVVDNANLVDTSGTINFRARWPRVYPAGIGNEATVKALYVHKASAGTGTHAVTLNAHREEKGSVATTHEITATAAGASSMSYNNSGQSFDVRVVRDDAVAMPAINNVTVDVDDVSEFDKTTSYTP